MPVEKPKRTKKGRRSKNSELAMVAVAAVAVTETGIEENVSPKEVEAEIAVATEEITTGIVETKTEIETEMTGQVLIAPVEREEVKDAFKDIIDETQSVLLTERNHLTLMTEKEIN